jgi:hypothetical protein
MKGEPAVAATSYTHAALPNRLARLKNLGEAQETVDEFRKGKVLRDRT